MKTITLSEEQEELITELAEKLATQNNRHTQFPLFVIQVDKKVYGDSSWCNESERRPDSDGEMCDNCKQKEEDNEELSDYCIDCDDECFVWYNVEETFDLQPGVFLTAEACEAHIKSNHYHYTNPRSYGISAWRNYEMQELIKLILQLAGKEIPSHYK